MAKQASEEAAFAHSCLFPCRRLATLRTDDRIDAGAAARGCFFASTITDGADVHSIRATTRSR